LLCYSILFTGVPCHKYNSLIFGHVRGSTCEDKSGPLNGHDLGWQRNPNPSGLQLAQGTAPALYLYQTVYLAGEFLKSSLVDEDDGLLVFPHGHKHGHWKRTPLGMDAVLDLAFDFYNTKNAIPGKSTGKAFSHIDADIGKLAATAQDGRRDSPALLQLRQAAAVQYIVPTSNNRKTSITLSSLEIPESDLINKSMAYVDVPTHGCTDSRWTASDPFKSKVRHGLSPRKHHVVTWNGDDLPGTAFAFHNGCYHEVKSCSDPEQKVDASLRKRLAKIAPLQPRDDKGRCTHRSALYPVLNNICLHGSGHFTRDASVLEVYMRGRNADCWPHPFTGNETKKRHQLVGTSPLGCPVGVSSMQLTPWARAMVCPGAWCSEPKATSWICEPLLNAPGDLAALQNAINNAVQLHREHMVRPLTNEYLERIKLFSDAEMLKAHIETQEKLMSTSDSLLMGSTRILTRPEITERAKKYYKKMTRKPYTFK